VKRFITYVVSYLIFGATAYGFLKAGLFVSSEYFSGATLPLVMITGAGCCIGYLIAITFVKGAGFKDDVE